MHSVLYALPSFIIPTNPYHCWLFSYACCLTRHFRPDRIVAENLPRYRPKLNV